MTLKVIGAGFGRTGTSSLQVALEQLGFGKCYHMREVFVHREHAPLWYAASQGQPVDWDVLFAGYQSTVDWPGCTFYQELMRHYPDAKVLLSVREPDKWYASALNTIYSSHKPSLANWLFRLNPRNRYWRGLIDTIWKTTFHGRFGDQAYAVEVFKRHSAEVQRVVPAERLLVYNVKEGWEPLCRFLDVPVPATPFPHLNDTAEFQRMVRRRDRNARLVVGGAVLGIMLVGGLLARRRQYAA